MEALMENPGLLHIGERILKNVPFKTQGQCRLVKRSWNQILEKEASKTKADLDDLLKSMKESFSKSDMPYESVELWRHFAMEMSSKINNHVINILLKKNIMSQSDVGFSSWPLEHFVSERDVQMVDVTLQQKFYYCNEMHFFWRLSRIIQKFIKRPNEFSYYSYFADRDFYEALQKAFKKRYTDVVQCFIRHKRKYVFGPTRSGNIDALKIVYPNPKEFLMVEFGENPIHIAASMGHNSIVKYFIENTEGLTAQDNLGYTPLCYAIINCHYSIFRMITKAVPEDHILKLIINGMNVIHIAAERGQFEVVYQLCKKVKNPIVTDRYGNSPIHFAASNGHLQMLKFLTSYGTDLMIPNENGKTPLKLAEGNGHCEVVEFLVECKNEKII